MDVCSKLQYQHLYQLQYFQNKVTGEENCKLHETKMFVFRDYVKYLPEWAQKEYFPDYNK